MKTFEEDWMSTEREIHERQTELVKGYLRQFKNVDPPGPGYYPEDKIVVKVPDE